MSVTELDFEDCINEIQFRLISAEHDRFKNILFHMTELEKGKESMFVCDSLIREEAYIAEGLASGVYQTVKALQSNNFNEMLVNCDDNGESIYNALFTMSDNFWGLFMRIALYSFEIVRNKKKFFEICDEYPKEVELMKEHGEKVEKILNEAE